MILKQKTTVAVLALLAVFAAAPVLADSDSDSDSGGGDRDLSTLVGSWEATDDNSPTEFLLTFEGGPTRGTGIITRSNNLGSASQGAWERTGPRTYSVTQKGFIFDANGDLVLKFKGNGEVEVSEDGNSLVVALVSELSDPVTGTVVITSTTTVSGTRITVE